MSSPEQPAPLNRLSCRKSGEKTSRLINNKTGLTLYTVPTSLATVLDSEQREKKACKLILVHDSFSSSKA